MSKKKIVVLTGAGMSAESGIQTFRGNGGLWEGYDIMEVASPEGWNKDPKMVLDFYNQRRKQAINALPNQGHRLLAELDLEYDVQIITQNVDNLHEQAGSKNVLHLHGELFKVRSTKDESLIYDLEGWELNWGDLCELKSQLRPHIVWFGEAVPMFEKAIEIARMADIFVVLGTSLAVYPAASIIDYIDQDVPKFIIDPDIPPVYNISKLRPIEKGASEGMKELIEHLKII